MKFAYLIMAHGQFDMLENLLHLLDDKQNDIYVHIDRKAVDFNPVRARRCCKFANIVFIPQLPFNWGGYSMINCELRLLEEAVKSPHDYYHLLSGVDLPLASAQELQAFFEEHSGAEFVAFCEPEWVASPAVRQRFTKYHWFLEHTDRNRRGIFGKLSLINDAIQSRLRVIDRTRKQNIKFYGGANWFSITDSLARYLLAEEPWIKKTFRSSLCCDEIFLQTVLMNSPFADKRYLPPKNGAVRQDCLACLRYFDWERGNPYVWRAGDERELLSCGCLFTRKFSCATAEESAVYSAISKIVGGL